MALFSVPNTSLCGQPPCRAGLCPFCLDLSLHESGLQSETEFQLFLLTHPKLSFFKQVVGSS